VSVFLTLIKDLLDPGRNWSEFSRKMISLLTFSLMAVVGTQTYLHFRMTVDDFVPVAERMDTRAKEGEQVKKLMDNMLHLHPEILSVWLYSWPDAANLDLVYNVGDPNNPLPTGHFWSTDMHDLGKLTLNVCTELNRRLDNTACSIFGAGDAWGLLVVVWDAEKRKPAGYGPYVAGIANRIAHLLYGK